SLTRPSLSSKCYNASSGLTRLSLIRSTPGFGKRSIASKYCIVFVISLGLVSSNWNTTGLRSSVANPAKPYRVEFCGCCFKKRFEKNRDKLFTFLDYDGIPWNNNNAEHAIKAFAVLRKNIDGMSTEKGMREYLTLLSICETCKYTGASFLDFLRSGE